MDLTKLNVSLTKHGAHKIALLLRKHPAGDVLDLVNGAHPTIDIDGVQARKNLSVDRSGHVPDVWDQARALGYETIAALSFIGIVFSHHELMDAMAKGRRGRLRGTVQRGAILDSKAFTNLKHTLVELGFSPLETPDKVDYDLKTLLVLPGLSPLVFDLLQRKMAAAGWDGTTDAMEEMVAHRFHEALAMSEAQFRGWLADAGQLSLGSEQDEDFFTGSDVSPTAKPFKFKAGHKARKTGKVLRRQSPAEQQAELIHNEIQTALFKKLAKRYGAANVGTEQPTGLGTAIDIVVQHTDHNVFYEIKIAPNLRACIRQALPQLMEYAYWRCSDDLASRLVIVGTFKMTAEVRAYLKFLRKRFGLPVWYQQFILKRLASKKPTALP